MGINASDGYINFFILGMDSGGKLIAFNKRCEELTGYRREEVLHKKIWNTIFPKDLKDRWSDIFSNRSYRLEIPILTKDGKTVELVWSPMQVGITSKELWLIGAEKSKENELWEILELEKGGREETEKKTETKTSKNEKTNLNIKTNLGKTSEGKIPAVAESLKYMEETINLLENQWTKLKEYANQLENLRLTLERYAESLEKEKEKLDRYRENIEKKMKRRLLLTIRDLQEGKKKLQRMDKWNALIEKVNRKMDEIERMRERLESLMERSLESSDNVENLKRQIRDLQYRLREYQQREQRLREELEHYRRREEKLDIKMKLLDEIRKKEREIIYRESELERRERMLRKREEKLNEREREIMRLLAGCVESSDDKREITSTEEVVDIFSGEKPAVVLKRGIIQKVNPSFLNMTGYDENEIINRNFFSLVDSEDLLNLQEYYLSKLKGNNDIPYCEVRVINSKKEKIPVKIRLERIRHEGDSLNVIQMERL